MHSFTTENWLSISTLIVTILTLGLGYIAYKRLLSQEASKKQLDVVLSLIQSIDKKDITIWIMENTRDYELVLKGINLFAIESAFKSPKELPLITIPKGLDFLQVNEFFHPLLPKLIVEAWEKIMTNFEPNLEMLFKHVPDLHYLMNSDKAVITLHQPYFMYKGGAMEFIQDSTKLKYCIISWLNKKGVKDLNPGLLSLKR